MEIKFCKYQGTGNDFIVIDGNKHSFSPTAEILTEICHRRFGIGADGVIIVKDHSEHDFEVIYYNPDGTRSFCGNGTRSAINFASRIGLVTEKNIRFLAYDGIHSATLLDDEIVRLEMRDVHSVRFLEDGIFVDTGSPHLVRFVSDLEREDVIGVGRKLRYEAPIDGGTNVNFVQKINENELSIRTYERGVENETFSCGTGVTASAIAGNHEGLLSPVKINTKGGVLHVEFTKSGAEHFSKIFLTGPAKCVFEGTYNFEIN